MCVLCVSGNWKFLKEDGRGAGMVDFVFGVREGATRCLRVIDVITRHCEFHGFCFFFLRKRKTDRLALFTGFMVEFNRRWRRSEKSSTPARQFLILLTIRAGVGGE